MSTNLFNLYSEIKIAFVYYSRLEKDLDEKNLCPWFVVCI